MTFQTVYRVLFLWILSLSVALASWRFMVIDPVISMPAMLHQLEGPKLAFYAHIIAAPVALALVPFQFWSRLRNRRPAVHRWTGRAYGVSILISGVGGLIIAPNADGGLVAQSGFFLLAVVWLGFTALAVWHAVNRRIAQHREWIIRSAALTLAAVTLRLYLPIGMVTVGFETAYPAIAWLCWVPNLLIAEWWLRRPSATQTA
jgi:hypothetical protein